MPTAVSSSKINTLLVSIKAQQSFLTKTNESKTKELVALQESGDAKRATTLSTNLENQKMNLIILGKMAKRLNTYLQDDNVHAFLMGNRILQDEHQNYGTKWSILSSISRLFIAAPTADIYSNYQNFVQAETKPLIDAEKAEQEREKAKLQAYFNSPEGKEMANTLSFISRG